MVEQVLVVWTGRLRSANDSHRIRHVECDGVKPSCWPCISTGRTCDFANPSAQSFVLAPSRSHKISPTSAAERKLIFLPILSSFPSPSTPFSSLELRHSNYLRTVCTNGLPGYFNMLLWEQTILQISHGERAIQLAATAVGALHCSQMGSLGEDKDVKDSMSDHAKMRYSQAKATLNRGIDKSSAFWELSFLRASCSWYTGLSRETILLRWCISKADLRFLRPSTLDHGARLATVIELSSKVVVQSLIPRVTSINSQQHPHDWISP